MLATSHPLGSQQPVPSCDRHCGCWPLRMSVGSYHLTTQFSYYTQHRQEIDYKLMDLCKKYLTPLLTHQSYVSLALIHQSLSMCTHLPHSFLCDRNCAKRNGMLSSMRFVRKRGRREEPRMGVKSTLISSAFKRQHITLKMVSHLTHWPC